MPSDPAITGRCYCGASHLKSAVEPFAVVYCHCDSCRRVSGAPVSCYAAFTEGVVTVTPRLGPPVSANSGANRWFCRACGSPLAAQFDYLPGRLFVPLGVLDQAATLRPTLHGFDAERLPWLHIRDQGLRTPGSVAGHVGWRRSR